MKLSWERWWQAVTAITVAVVGLHPEDLADQLWRDWWMEGVSPKTAVKRALRNEGVPGFVVKL
jgi:hypothetical protein